MLCRSSQRSCSATSSSQVCACERKVVGQPALEVEVGLDEGLSRLAALDLFFAYARHGVDGLRPVGAEDGAPSVTMAFGDPWRPMAACSTER